MSERKPTPEEIKANPERYIVYESGAVFDRELGQIVSKFPGPYAITHAPKMSWRGFYHLPVRVCPGAIRAVVCVVRLLVATQRDLVALHSLFEAQCLWTRIRKRTPRAGGTSVG